MGLRIGARLPEADGDHLRAARVDEQQLAREAALLTERWDDLLLEDAGKVAARVRFHLQGRNARKHGSSEIHRTRSVALLAAKVHVELLDREDVSSKKQLYHKPRVARTARQARPVSPVRTAPCRHPA